MSCIMMHLFALYLLFLPLSSPVDPETDDGPRYDYTPDDQPFFTELPGKKKPLDHSYIAHTFSLMLAFDFANVVDNSYSDA